MPAVKLRYPALIVILGACLWLAPASGASTATVVKKCGQGRAASYKLKPSDAVFLRNFLNCVLSADGLHAHPKNTIGVYNNSPTGALSGSPNTTPTSFPKFMAPTVAGFAKASKSDENWKYINSKVTAAYQETDAGVLPGFYTVYGDTTPPSPTLAQVATAIAPARRTIDKFYKAGHQPPLAIDVVVQKGAWFHNGNGVNLRYMVLLKAVLS
jgi:hypothetical protein